VASDTQTPFRLLLVEDSEADVELIRIALGETESRVTLEVASDAIEAVERLTSGDPLPHLVLLDLRLPGESGFAVLDHIKEDEVLRSIPVLILSSSAAPADVKRAYAAHANTYLQKPTEFSELVELMETVDAYWLGQARLAAS
jgi:CheY-like chemotaxis protein